jgi:hypothetical protein
VAEQSPSLLNLVRSPNSSFCHLRTLPGFPGKSVRRPGTQSWRSWSGKSSNERRRAWPLALPRESRQAIAELECWAMEKCRWWGKAAGEEEEASWARRELPAFLLFWRELQEDNFNRGARTASSRAGWGAAEKGPDAAFGSACSESQFHIYSLTNHQKWLLRKHLSVRQFLLRRMISLQGMSVLRAQLSRYCTCSLQYGSMGGRGQWVLMPTYVFTGVWARSISTCDSR